MSTNACRSPLEGGELLGYWLGELDATREAEIDEHLFACRPCGEALERIVALGDAVRTLIARGDAAAIVPLEFVARLKAAGLRVSEYRLAPQGSVQCTIAPHDDLVVAHLAAPLEGVQRLDVMIHEVEANRTLRLTDVAFNAANREVVLLPKARDLRQIDVGTQRVELIAVSGAGDRVIGEYRFNHSRYRGE
jgi:hypothetical protein